MRQASTIFLFSILLAVQTPAGQLLKIPRLVQHYVMHQQRHPDSWIQFLQIHYGSTHRDADWPEDEQLPFKQMQLVDLSVALLAPSLPALAKVEAIVPKKISLPQSYCAQLYLNLIFHPPQPLASA